MNSLSASIIIPTLQPGAALPLLITALRAQTCPPAEILVIDSSSPDGAADQARHLGCQVEVIPQAAFDHGGTRNLGAARAAHRCLVFMTQDALPADTQYLERLLAPLRGGCTAAYARQIPYPGATPLEQFHRAFNYPPEAQVRQAADLPRLGIKAAFFSNVASAVDRQAFVAAGGFPEGVVLNEDMMLALRLLRAGGRIAYAADARVYHSHAYSTRQQFRRYFDIGASHVQASRELRQLPAIAEGIRYARSQWRWLMRHRAWVWLPRAGAELVTKWAAFQLGRRYRQLPPALVRRCSLQPGFWTKPPARQSAAAASGPPARF